MELLITLDSISPKLAVKYMNMLKDVFDVVKSKNERAPNCKITLIDRACKHEYRIIGTTIDGILVGCDKCPSKFTVKARRNESILPPVKP